MLHNKHNIKKEKKKAATTKEKWKIKHRIEVRTWNRWNTQKASLWLRTQSKQPRRRKALRSHELSSATHSGASKTSLAGWFCSGFASAEPYLSPFQFVYTFSFSQPQFFLFSNQWKKERKQKQKNILQETLKSVHFKEINKKA